MQRAFPVCPRGFRHKILLGGWAFSLMLPLAAFLHLVPFHRELRPQSRQTAQQVSRQIEGLAPAFGAPVQLIETPAFHAETFPAWGANAGPRAIWVAAFLAEGRRYAVVINAETGTLAYLTCQSDRRPKPAFVRMAPIETPHQAAEAALHRLRDLRLVRPGTKVWLKQSPQQITRRQEWKVVWLARSPWAPQPYEVRLVLSCIGGFPLEAVNRGEMRPGAGP